MKAFFLLGIVLASCSLSPVTTDSPILLALGDSYTIGSSVPLEENFPYQFHRALELPGAPEIIARIGWSTSDLLSALENYSPPQGEIYVTLLIGVNNQYRGMDFSLYQKEFPELLDLALRYTGGDKNRVKVLSIPDYWFTPFGQNYHKSTSEEIDQYNAFTRTFAASKSVEFIDITDISRRGLVEPQLVAEDGLHLSSLAYEEIAQRIENAFLQE